MGDHRFLHTCGQTRMNREQRDSLKLAVDAGRRALEAKSLSEPGRVEIPFGRTLYRLTVKARHGTENAYVHYRCRCRDCRAAATEARARRRRKARQPLSEAERVRAAR